MITIGLPTLMLIPVIWALLVIPFWQIWKKSGHSGWWSFCMVVPGVNIISVYVLAFKEWPALRHGRSQ